MKSNTHYTHIQKGHIVLKTETGCHGWHGETNEFIHKFGGIEPNEWRESTLAEMSFLNTALENEILLLDAEMEILKIKMELLESSMEAVNTYF